MRWFKNGTAGRLLVRLLAVGALGAILLFTGCINPFDSSAERSAPHDDESAPEFGSISVKSDSVRASTIAPDLSDLKGQIDTYNLTLTNITPGSYDPIIINGYVEGTPINDIPVPGTWDIVLTGLNGASQIVAEGLPVFPTANPVSIQDATPVSVTIDLLPVASVGGTGELNFTLDYSLALGPGVQVDEVVVELYSFATGEPEDVRLTAGTPSVAFIDPDVSDSAIATANFAGDSVTIVDPDMPSGSYRILISLGIGTGQDWEPYAPVIEAVQIYDNLVSSGTVTLAAGDLTSPPDPPTDMVVEFTGENVFNVSWVDESNTETGFRIYEDDGVTRQQLGADLTSNTEQASGLSSSFGLNDDLTLEVVSFNQYGESDPLSFEFRVLPAVDFPSFINSPRTNSPFWAAAYDTGSVTWSTMIIGASSVNLYLDTGSLDDVNNLPAPIDPGGPPYDLSASGPFAQGTTYNWRIETIGEPGNEGRVIYPVDQITIRDGTLYVDGTGTGASAGSALDPLDSVLDAVDLSEQGETIRVTQGTYDQGPVTIVHDLTILGSYETTAYLTRTATPSTTITSAVADTFAISATGIVALDGVEVRAPSPPAGNGPIALRMEAGDLTVVDSTVIIPSDGTYDGGGIAMGIRAVGNNSSLTVTDSLISVGGAINNAVRGIWITNSTLTVTIQGSSFATDALTASSLNWISITPSASVRTVEVMDSTFSGEIIGSSGYSSTLEVVGDSPSTSILFAENVVNPINNENRQLYGISLQGAVGTTAIRHNRFDMMKPGGGNVFSVASSGVGGQTPLIEGNRIQIPARTTSGSSNGIHITGDSGADIANNVIEFGGDNATLASYGILTTSLDTRVVNNTLVVGPNYGGGAATTFIWFQTGAAGIAHNSILWSRPPALHTGIQNDVGTDLDVTTNVFFGTSDDVITLNAQDSFAGNVEIDPNLMTAPGFVDPDWYRPNVPAATGTPTAVRSLVLAGGIEDHRGAGGLAEVDISGDPRATGPVSIGAYQVSDTTPIGAIGPSGGLVFYENPTYRDAGETWRYMEAADSDLVNELPWGGSGIEMGPGLDRSNVAGEVGAGQANTDIIVTAIGAGDTYAAGAADSFSDGVFADWFLPSIPELSAIHDNLYEADLGDLSGQYWSSQDSQHLDNSDYANGLQIGVGTSGTAVGTLRTNNRLIRPVRRF